MRYVGLDVHWRQSTFCVLDDRGRKIETRTVRGSCSKVTGELSEIRRPFAVCFEATHRSTYLVSRFDRGDD